MVFNKIVSYSIRDGIVIICPVTYATITASIVCWAVHEASKAGKPSARR
jgi:hypothetical protein